MVSFSCLLESAYLCLCHNAIIAPSFFAVALDCPSLSLACAEEKKNDSFMLIRLVRIILFDFMDWHANVACLGREMLVFFSLFLWEGYFLFLFFFWERGFIVSSSAMLCFLQLMILIRCNLSALYSDSGTCNPRLLFLFCLLIRDSEL